MFTWFSGQIDLPNLYAKKHSTSVISPPSIWWFVQTWTEPRGVWIIKGHKDPNYMQKVQKVHLWYRYQQTMWCMFCKQYVCLFSPKDHGLLQGRGLSCSSAFQNISDSLIVEVQVLRFAFKIINVKGSSDFLLSFFSNAQVMCIVDFKINNNLMIEKWSTLPLLNVF